jgi:methylisocitrate lyase
MNKAAETVYQTIRKDGGQAAVLDQMQTRQDLYDAIGYWEFEHRLDQLFAKGKH